MDFDVIPFEVGRAIQLPVCADTWMHLQPILGRNYRWNA